jgi:hypothetical protein
VLWYIKQHCNNEDDSLLVFYYHSFGGVFGPSFFLFNIFIIKFNIFV